MGHYSIVQHTGDRGRYIAGSTIINVGILNQALDQFERVLAAKLDTRIENIYFFGDVVLLPNNHNNEIPEYFIIDTGKKYKLYQIYNIRNGDFELAHLAENNDFETLVDTLSEIDDGATDFYYYGVEDDECWDDEDEDDVEDWKDDFCVVNGTANGENVIQNDDIDGDYSGDIIGQFNGDIYGNLFGDVMGQMNGDIYGDMKGHVRGQLNGDIHGDLYGNIYGQMNGDIYGRLLGRVIGEMNGEIGG